MPLARLFIRSAGALLLAVAFALILTNFATGELAQPRDPLLQVSIRLLFWICGMAFLMVALLCLFGRWEFTQLSLLAWISINLVVYVVGLFWTGVNNPGFLFASLSDTFGVSSRFAMTLGAITLAYLFCGSITLLPWLWWGARTGKWAVHPDQFLKMFCPACGGHIQYAAPDAGREIPCPHCTVATLLRKPENLKMACYFCKEHIEFPPHAIGTKMPCPHCQRGITLKELAPA